jgi:segregation and condensation protein A
MTPAPQDQLFPDEDQIACLVRTEAFEGPLDLLLHLIKKNEVDIYNIPMAAITRQYLDYLDVMRELNLDVAGEFLVMASTLIQIKSQMLLPQGDEPGLDEDKIEDPRAELVRRLLDYERYRDASIELAAGNLLERDVFARNFVSAELDAFTPEEALPEIELFELVDAFRRILAKAPRESFHEVGSENISIADRISDILEVLQGRESVDFEELFAGSSTREYIVASFLAILELCRLRMIRILQFETFGRLLVKNAVILATDTAVE